MSEMSEHDKSHSYVDVDVEKESGLSLHPGHEGAAGVDPQTISDSDGVAPTEESTQAKLSVHHIKSVPNGGLTAWLQVLGTFFLCFNCWGVINAFGAYQTYYETGMLSSSSPSDISWIGSLQIFLLLFGGAVTGPIYDSGYIRSLVLVGSFLVVFGQMMLSLCHNYWQVVLAQGICIGLGSGCLFTPGVAILSTYFSTKMSTAIGLAVVGSSLGGVIYPIVFYKLEPGVGFAWASRTIAFVMLATLTVSNSVLKVRVLPSARRRFFDLAAFKEAPYTLYVIGGFVGLLGLYAPFFYVQTYAIRTGIMGPDLAFYLVSVLNAGSIFGRSIPGYLADRVGPINMIIPCTFGSGILALCLIPITTTVPLFIVSALYGFTSGTFVSLVGPIFISLTANRALIGTRMGMGFAVCATAVLFGTPICGWILDASSFTDVWIYSGVLQLVSACVIVACRIAQGGWGLTAKM